MCIPGALVVSWFNRVRVRVLRNIWVMIGIMALGSVWIAALIHSIRVIGVLVIIGVGVLHITHWHWRGIWLHRRLLQPLLTTRWAGCIRRGWSPGPIRRVILSST